MSTTEFTTKPPPDVEGKRHRRSQRARAHVVSLGQCPQCGETLPAATAAEVKRGDAKCPGRFR